MSKKHKGSSAPSGGFISFSDVLSNSHNNNVSASIEPSPSFSSSSSSSSSSSLGALAQSPTTTTSTTATTTTAPSAAHLSPLYVGSNEILSVACKKLVKRDSTTRSKAYHEISEVLKQQQPPEITSCRLLEDFLAHFLYLYPRLAIDNVPRLRVQLHQVLHEIVKANRATQGPTGIAQLFAPYVNTEVFALWWISTHDVVPEVAKEALAAYELAIPPKRRLPVLTAAARFILTKIAKFLALTPAEIVSTESLSTEEAEERIERVHAASLLSFAHMLESLESPINDAFTSQCGQVMTNAAWKKCLQAKPARVRAAGFRLLTVICQRLPEALLIHPKSSAHNSNTPSNVPAAHIAQMRIKFVSNVHSAVFGESYEANLQIAFQALLLLMHSEGYWAVPDTQSIATTLIAGLQQIVVNSGRPLNSNLTHARENLQLVAVADILTSLVGALPVSLVSLFAIAGATGGNCVMIALKDICQTMLDRASSEMSTVQVEVAVLEACTVMLLRKDSNSSDNNLSGTVDSALRSSIIDVLLRALTSYLSKSPNPLNADLCNDPMVRILVQLQRGTILAINAPQVDWDAFLWSPILQCLLKLLNGVETGSLVLVDRLVSLLDHGNNEFLTSLTACTQSPCMLLMQRLVSTRMHRLKRSLGETVDLTDLECRVTDVRLVLRMTHALSDALRVEQEFIWGLSADSSVPLLFQVLGRQITHSASASTLLKDWILVLIETKSYPALAVMCDQFAISQSIASLAVALPYIAPLEFANEIESNHLLPEWIRTILLEFIDGPQNGHSTWVGVSSPVAVACDLMLWLDKRLDWAIHNGGFSSQFLVERVLCKEIGQLSGDAASVVIRYLTQTSISVLLSWVSAENPKYPQMVAFLSGVFLLPDSQGRIAATLLLRRIFASSEMHGNLSLIISVLSGAVKGLQLKPPSGARDSKHHAEVGYRILEAAATLSPDVLNEIWGAFLMSKSTFWRAVFAGTSVNSCQLDAALILLERSKSQPWRLLMPRVSDGGRDSSKVFLDALYSTVSLANRDLESKKLATRLTAYLLCAFDCLESTVQLVTIAVAFEPLCVVTNTSQDSHPIFNTATDRSAIYNIDEVAVVLADLAMGPLSRFQAKSNVSGSTHDHHRVALRCPQGVDVEVERGIKVWHLQHNSGEDKIFSWTAIEAELVGIHRELGPTAEPYYTVRLLDGSNRELQTEWHKLLTAAPSVADETIIPIVNITSEESIVIKQVCEFAADLFKSVGPGESTSGMKASSFHLLRARTASRLIEQLGRLADTTFSRRISVIFSAIVIGPARSLLASSLSSLQITDQVQASGTLLLLRSLVASRTALGASALWLPPIISQLHRIEGARLQAQSRLSQLMSSTNDEGLNLVTSTFCETLSSLASAVECRQLTSVASKCAAGVASIYIRSIRPSDPDQTILGHLLQLMSTIWRHHALISSESSSSTANMAAGRTLAEGAGDWEGLALGLCVEVIVAHPDTDSGSMLATSNRIAHVARQAVHWCVNGRSRTEADQLVSAWVQSTDVNAAGSIDGILAIVLGKTPGYGVFTRGVLAKVLDVYYASASFTPNYAIQSGLTASSVGLGDDELEEIEGERILLLSVLGANIMEALSLRFTESTGLNCKSSYQSSTKKKSSNVETFEPVESDEDSDIDMHDTVGAIILWLLCLQRIDRASTDSRSQEVVSAAAESEAEKPQGNLRAKCGHYLYAVSGWLKHALFMCSQHCDWLRASSIHGMNTSTVDSQSELANLFQRLDFDSLDPQFGHDSEGGSNEYDSNALSNLAAYAVFRTVHVLPAMVRNWWSDDCDRLVKNNLSKFVEEKVRHSLLLREMAMIHVASSQQRWDPDQLTIAGSAMTGEVVAGFTRDESKVELRIKLPPSYPLKNVEVECSSKLGISEGRWRRWVLQMVRLLSVQDGTVVDAVLMWKDNLDKEFEDVEPCPICYSVLHPKSMAMPSMACPTCNNKFHSTCLQQWFRSSGKSKCVICQQPFFA